LLKLVVEYVQASRHSLDRETLEDQLREAGLSPDLITLLVDDKLAGGGATFARQPDPQPPPVPGQGSPSLLLYGILTLVAGVLVLLPFALQQPDWMGLSVNLATEIIGAVVILVIVDRRLRSSEISAIRDYARSSSIRLTSVFSSQIRAAVRYAQALSNELERIRPKPYLERPNLEALLERAPSGFLLIGESGSGKSTLLQAIAARQAEALLRRPSSARIPIFFPARLWSECGIRQQIWELACRYSKLKRKHFDRWLARGRLVLILDGLNESVQPQEMLHGIQEFKERYPDVTLIASCRSSFLPQAMGLLDLQTVEMPLLTEREVEALYRRFSTA
jgi:hypothetical protein